MFLVNNKYDFFINFNIGYTNVYYFLNIIFDLIVQLYAFHTYIKSIGSKVINKCVEPTHKSLKMPLVTHTLATKRLQDWPFSF